MSPTSPSPAALELARRLASLPEPVMREQVLLEYLSGADLEPVVAVLAELHAMGARAGPPFNLALLALAGVLGRGLLSYDVRARLYTAARQANQESLLEIFLTGRGETASESRAAPDRELTLGHRKTLARSTRRETLQKLLLDPEPEVIPILLRNPRLTERDVVHLAARRPTGGELQWCVFRARRWIACYAVKRTLVLNPCTPSDLSLRLLPFLRKADLRLVRSSPGLPAAVRQAAERLELQQP